MREARAGACGGSSAGAGAGRDLLVHQFDELRPRLTSVALRFARDRHSAEDIVQSAFEKALRNLHQFRGRARLSTWLHRIVVNESLMWLRAEGRRRRRTLPVHDWQEADWPEPGPDPAEGLATRQDSERLHAGIARLPEEEREVLLRCSLEGASYAQFSAETGVHRAAAKSRAYRGRQRLRSLLAEA